MKCLTPPTFHPALLSTYSLKEDIYSNKPIQLLLATKYNK